MYMKYCSTYDYDAYRGVHSSVVLVSDKVYEQQHPYKLHTVALKLQQAVKTKDGS